MNQRRTYRGYLDMGAIRIPPLPLGVVLTDRDDGTLWLLSHNTDDVFVDGLGRISLNTTLLNNAREYRVYGAYDGPLLGANPTVRLMVRGGNLGYDTGPSPYEGALSSPVHTRVGLQRVSREIYLRPSWRTSSDVLAWRDTEF